MNAARRNALGRHAPGRHALRAGTAALSLAVLLGTALPVAADPFMDALRAERRARHALSLGLDATPTGTVVPAGEAMRTLHHLPPSPRGWRLEGETARLEWPVHVPRSLAGGGATLRLAFTNALSVMPEMSRLAVRVNGREVAATPIDAAGGTVLEVPLSSGVLSAGVNALSVHARQRHRVDCSVDATRELWTAIDPARTGLVFERGNASMSHPHDLAGIARGPDGRVTISVLGADHDEARSAARLAVMQRVALASGFMAPRVEWTDAPGAGPGLDLFVGTREELARAAPAVAAVIPSDRAVQVIAADGAERVTLVVLGEAGREALRAALAAPAPEGTAHGRMALERRTGMLARAGREITFADAGMQGLEFAGRLHAQDFDVVLPPDAMPADYAEAELTLTTAHVGGLARGAEARVMVNGAPVAHLSLVSPRRRLSAGRTIELPMGLFAPGRNRIGIEAETPARADTACGPDVLTAYEPRFMLDPEGSIRFPKVARMGRLPDLAVTMATGYPYVDASERRPVTVLVPAPDDPAHRTSMNAAGALLARLAAAAEAPLDARVRFGAGDGNGTIETGRRGSAPPRDAIVVAPRASLDALLGAPATERLAGLTGNALARWAPSSFVADATPGATLPTIPARADLDPMAVGSIERDPPMSLADRWAEPDDGLDLTGWARSAARSVVRHTRDTASRIGGRTGTADPFAPLDDAGDALLGQFVHGQGAARGTWTVLTAPDAGTLSRAADALADPDVTGAVAGAASALDIAEAATTVRSARVDASLAPLIDRSPGNLRLVAAGWLADNGWAYGAMLMLALGGAGLLTNRTLRRAGHRPDGGRR